ncbi:SUMF1/EgtB/PvdO family nonheme iron enzyme [Tepidibacter formicigenes]|jgi:hypothetical protein|uniref:Sulfatase-modifying factor enzyme 1 n=1 Tax=Tepidibacter formicigenes DSM 15518 TaxID=1123349 RepID=A0A1M6Q200_9FIRM|nr:SUMF1/EgtB/PvdO family nonheme iron enzyme [Tepidibacter formicigenes]SHK14229.1 Sulfatase-modifying factor enzyme 1 [Tepidibacter formicigenes DSM 15518]
MTNFDDLKLSVEAISGGKNTVILDDLGMPSIVVPFPKLKYSDIIAGGSQDALPAFIVDGEEVDVIHVSKYQNIVVNSRAYSLPFKDPRVYVDFDTALASCRNKGAGWHLNTNALWAAIQSWCYKNNTVPHGNSNYGQDYSNPHEKGVVTYKYESNGQMYNGRTATGSGPVTWYHNYDSSGIADLCGNIWEWAAGMRLVNGEIQIIPNGNSMKLDCNMSSSSTEWKAIMPDGTLVTPGTAGTLKYDGETASGGVRLNTEIEFSTETMSNTYTSKQFGTLTAKTGVAVPQLLKGLGLFPIPDYDYGNGNIWIRNHEAERVPFRGASWYHTSSVGVAALSLYYPRSGSGSDVGFRSAFCEKLKTGSL